ncbi:MAG: TadE/TadG family type IV pilus assembly protein [Alphaproteobacteria bacterium]
MTPAFLLRWRERLGRFRRENRGVAAIEFAAFAGFLSIARLNVVDLARYVYERMQVENAAEMGAMAAFKTCDLNKVPATTKCSGLNSAINAAITSTTLGANVSLAEGSPSEGYYCVTSSGTLQYVSDVSVAPADCSSVANPEATPGDYLRVDVTYSFRPLFTGVSIGGLLPTTITESSMIRLK